jgi:hypothetical protein
VSCVTHHQCECRAAQLFNAEAENARLRAEVVRLTDIAEAAQEVASPDYLTAPGPYAEGVRLDAMRDLMAALARLDTEGAA